MKKKSISRREAIKKTAIFGGGVLVGGPLLVKEALAQIAENSNSEGESPITATVAIDYYPSITTSSIAIKSPDHPLEVYQGQEYGSKSVVRETEIQNNILMGSGKLINGNVQEMDQEYMRIITNLPELLMYQAAKEILDGQLQLVREQIKENSSYASFSDSRKSTEDFKANTTLDWTENPSEVILNFYGDRGVSTNLTVHEKGSKHRETPSKVLQFGSSIRDLIQNNNKAVVASLADQLKTPDALGKLNNLYEAVKNYQHK